MKYLYSLMAGLIAFNCNAQLKPIIQQSGRLVPVYGFITNTNDTLLWYYDKHDIDSIVLNMPIPDLQTVANAGSIVTDGEIDLINTPIAYSNNLGTEVIAIRSSYITIDNGGFRKTLQAIPYTAIATIYIPDAQFDDTFALTSQIPQIAKGNVDLVDGTATVYDHLITSKSVVVPVHGVLSGTTIAHLQVIINDGEGFTINSLNANQQIETDDKSNIIFIIYY